MTSPKLRRASFTHFGKGPRKTWVLRLEGEEVPEPGEQVHVYKRPKEGQPPPPPQVRTISRVLWSGPGKEGEGIVWLCAFLSKADEELLALARQVTGGPQGLGAPTLAALGQSLAERVIRKLIGTDRPQEEKEEANGQ